MRSRAHRVLELSRGVGVKSREPCAVTTLVRPACAALADFRSKVDARSPKVLALSQSVLVLALSQSVLVLRVRSREKPRVRIFLCVLRQRLTLYFV